MAIDYINPGGTYWPVTDYYWPQTFYYWPLSSDVVPEPDECFITIPTPGSIASRYFIILRDVNGNIVALFDHWIGLSWRLAINEVTEGILILGGTDARILLFEEDYRIEVFRSVPGANLTWYEEFAMLVDGFSFSKGENGEKQFNVELVELNDFARRRVVAYKAGTLGSDKSGAADTVMQEYADENLGTNATVAHGRLIDGVTPNMAVGGANGKGKYWQGSASGQPLINVLQEIAKFSSVDFAVVKTGNDNWRFTVFPNMLGSDRTNANMDANTGFNGAGNAPVYFSVPFGTVAIQVYRKSRRNEANTIIVWGKGERSTQKVIISTNDASRAITKYNKRELSASGGSAEYEYQLRDIGDGELEVNIYEETFEMIPLQQVSQLYGKHYFIGDRIMVIDERTQQLHTKRLMAVNGSIDGSSKQEQLSFEFE